MVTRVRSAVRLALALALSVLVTQATVMPDGVALAQPPPGGGGGPGRPPPGGGRPPPGGGSFGSRVLDGLRDAGTGLATDLVGNQVGGGGPGGQGLWQGGEDERDNANPLQVIPGAPPEIQEAAAALLDSRDNVNVEKITADRPAYLLPKDERVSKAIGLNGLLAGPSAFRPSFGPSFEATLVGIDEDHQAQLDEHIAALEEEFNNPSYASFNPQGLEPANERNFVPDESWPKISFMVENWPADDPLGCK